MRSERITLFSVELAFTADSSRLASSSRDGTVQIWDADTGEQQLALHTRDAPDERAHFPDPAVRPGSLALSPDGAWLAYARADGSIWIWPLDLDELIEFAKHLLNRTLTDEECRQYLHVDRCPQA